MSDNEIGLIAQVVWYLLVWPLLSFGLGLLLEGRRPNLLERWTLVWTGNWVVFVLWLRWELSPREWDSPAYGCGVVMILFGAGLLSAIGCATESPGREHRATGSLGHAAGSRRQKRRAGKRGVH